MTNNEILIPLKIDLQISTTAMDDYLLNLIDKARMAIKTEGITISDWSIPDGMLVEEYAAYLYRHRREGSPMPRMLRYDLNQRLFREKAGAGNG